MHSHVSFRIAVSRVAKGNSDKQRVATFKSIKPFFVWHRNCIWRPKNGNQSHWQWVGKDVDLVRNMNFFNFFYFPEFPSNAVESSLMPLQAQAQIQPQQQPQQPQNHTKRKKSILLNLKSGAINSVTFDVFGNYSTRFAGDTHGNIRRRRNCLLIGGIVLSCLCFFAFGIAISKLFDAASCQCKSIYIYECRIFSVCSRGRGGKCACTRDTCYLSMPRA